MWDNGSLVDILIRVDVKTVSQVFLVNLLDVARKNDWLLRTQDERVFRPSLTKLLSAIHKSDAFRFVENPHAFLEALDKARQSDPDDATT